MSTLPTQPVEYKLVSIDADRTPTEWSESLTKLGREGWTLVNSFHIHHLNAVQHVFVRPLESSTV